MAKLIRKAIEQFVARVKSQRSMCDLPPKLSGRMRGRRARGGLIDEMRRR